MCLPNSHALKVKGHVYGAAQSISPGAPDQNVLLKITVCESGNLRNNACTPNVILVVVGRCGTEENILVCTKLEGQHI